MTNKQDAIHKASIETILDALDYREECIVYDSVYSEEEKGAALAAIAAAREWIKGVRQ